MKKKTVKFLKKLIEEQFLTDWEFVVQVMAPEVDIEEFDVDEAVAILNEEIMKRRIDLYKEHGNK